jgi:para-nitrobenzyl esterase
MRVGLKGVWVVACWALACGGEVAPPGSSRSTLMGDVLGAPQADGSDAWLGIPFAAPPVGALRWRAPQPPPRWTSARPASVGGPACPQLGPGGLVIGKEDCLTLDVWAPHQQRGLPVMVWIHGGGNTAGGTTQSVGGQLAASGGVVVVAVQYRLGPLGWFRQRALRGTSADPNEQSGNFGTLDLLQALAWVRDNIAAFGGDPARVTVFGESSGGMDVYSLLVSPLASGLFQQAAIESGGLSSETTGAAENFVDDPTPGDLNSADEVILRLLAEDGVTDRAAAKKALARLSDAELAAYLRLLTPGQLLRAYDTQATAGILHMPSVFCDGTVLPADDWSQHLARADGWNQVPVLVGTNLDEAKLFLFANSRAIHWKDGFIPQFVDPPLYEGVASALSRMWKAVGADGPAALMRASGEKEIYAYRFDWRGEPPFWGADLSRMLGAAHGVEVPFVSGNFDLGLLGNLLWNPEDTAARDGLSRTMISYWSTFARTGAPSGPAALPPWAAWDNTSPDAPKFLVLDTPPAGIHPSTRVESPDAIVADVDVDPRLPTQKDKCEVYHDLTGAAPGLSKADYPHLGTIGCAAYPWDAYPWDGAP